MDVCNDVDKEAVVCLERGFKSRPSDFTKNEHSTSWENIGHDMGQIDKLLKVPGIQDGW